MNPVLLQARALPGALVRPADRGRRGAGGLDLDLRGQAPRRGPRARVGAPDLVLDLRHHRRAAVPRFLHPDGQLRRAGPIIARTPFDIITFWDGGFRGLGIYGAVAGGVLAVLLYTRRHHLSPAALARHPCARAAAGAGDRPHGQPDQPGTVRPGDEPAVGVSHRPALPVPGAGRLAERVRAARPADARGDAWYQYARLPPDVLLRECSGTWSASSCCGSAAARWSNKLRDGDIFLSRT